MRMINRSGLWLLLILVGLAGCQSEQMYARNGEGFYRKAVFDLSSPAMEGRGPGTKGLDKARDYLVSHMERMELEPAFGDSYTQPFEIPMGMQVTDHALEFTAGSGRPVALKANKDYAVVGQSSSDHFSGEAVFVGYGLQSRTRNFNSYQNISAEQVEGKVVIVFRYEPMTADGQSKWMRTKGRWTGAASLSNKARWAREMGASAMIVVDPPHRPLKGELLGAEETHGRSAHMPVFHVSVSALRQMIDSAGGDADDVFARWQEAAEKPTIGALTLKNVRLEGLVEMEPRRVTIHNVAGVIPGRGNLKDEVIFIGAHYDHIGHGEFASRTPHLRGHVHPGADDNASGTAALLLIAQHFVNQRKHALESDITLTEHQRTLIFGAFSGEERGLLGSSHMVENIEEMGIKHEDIAGMINMDMVGRIAENKLMIFGVGSGDLWEQLLNLANEKAGFNLLVQKTATQNSDHAVFERRRIPVLHFFSGLHEDYHAATDTPDKINVADAVRMIDMIIELLELIDAQPQRMAYVESGPRDPHAGLSMDSQATDGGSRPRLGISPDYQTLEGDQGCGVGDVYEDTPAHKAGIKKGDLIVGWNGKTIGNVQDLTDALANSEVDEDVTLKVRRGSETLEVKVTLTER